MKTAQEILREIEARKMFCLVGSQKDIAIELAKTFAIEVAKEALKNASENYTILFDGQEYAVSGINDSENIPEV